MPRCTGCGSEVPGAARFCPLCGKDTAAPALQQTQAMGAMNAGAVTGGNRNMVPYAVAAGLAVIAIAGFLFLKTAGLLSAKKTEAPTSGVLAAPPTQTAPAPIMTAPGTELPKAPVMKAPATVGNPMPEDVIAYLRWLKQFERARKDLESRSASQAMTDMQSLMLDLTTGRSMGLLDADSTGESPPEYKTPNYAANMSKIIAEWNQAAAEFSRGNQQLGPPNPCVPLATSYQQALASGIQQMGQIQQMMTSALQSIKAASGQHTPDSTRAQSELFNQKNQRGMSRNVDTAFNDADAALDSLRDQYTNVPADIDKQHFNIETDSGNLKLPLPNL
jgi:hypothetical protein